MRRLALAAPVLLIVQAVLVHYVSAGERPPAAPDLARFPASFAHWQIVSEDFIAADVQQTLHADRLLSRSYTDQQNIAGLLVAWFQSQRSGLSQPHSPQVCLPASGWTPEIRDEVTLDTAAGPIAVNRLIVSNRGQRDVVLYWYQMQRRVVEGEWAAKLWTVANAVRDRRTDTALVRIVVVAPGGDTAAATTAAVQFGRDLYPVLLENFPPVR
jgi:EpsI family protein